jgi:hypothetical protein
MPAKSFNRTSGGADASLSDHCLHRNVKTFISALLPTSMAQFLPHAAIQSIVETVEGHVRKILDEAKG